MKKIYVLAPFFRGFENFKLKIPEKTHLNSFHFLNN